MSSARSTRTLRGVVAAAFSTFVALLSHVAGGGSMPGVLGLVVPLMFSTLVCVLLAGRRLSIVRLSLSVAVSQVLFHTLFVLGAAQGSASTAMPSGHAAHGAHVTLDASSMPMMHDGHAGAGMWFAHVIAGLVTIAALHRAETLLSTVAAVKEFVLARLVPTVLAALAAPVRPARVRLQSDVPTLRTLGVYPATTALRGPPALTSL
ncbi:hypothetical protein KXS11_05990 [Plantibacter flavus]|uniref:hypothetical protein n=1 Tax=Plantibacter flavus TaxID=150123 RepID=UPI003F182816